jgi:isoquinoline 1-oxidoreductase beta subunit
MEVPEDVPFKELNEYKIIGQEKRNVDLDKIITGQPLFGIDTKKEGMMYACMMRPPAFGQELSSYDDSAAKAVIGVEQVIQIENKIAIIASNTWAAMKGKNAIVAQWKDSGDLDNTVDHDKTLLALLDKNADEPLRKDGDQSKAFAEADYVLDKTYEAPFLPHNCMEPMNFFADVQGDKVSMTGPIQTPQWTQNRVAEKIEVKPEDVSIMMTRMGGGFGRRLYGDFAEESAQVSKAAKVPIQLVFSREDDMTAGTYRPCSKYRIQASVKEGKLTGYKLTEACVNGNMYGLIPNFFPAAAIQNYEVHAHKIDSKITTGAWRAPYTNFLAFAEQSFFDELANKLEIDAVQLRLDLLENAKNNIDDKIEYSPERMQAVIKLAADKSGWGKAASGVYQGFSAYYSHNTHVAEVAEVVLEDDMPVVKKVYCAVDCGLVINPIAARNQIQGGVIDGIGHAMFGDLTFDNGKPSAQNFNKYRLIRMSEAPEVEVYFVENNLSPTGLGEPSLPPAGGAIANAIHAATGKRVYKQPFIKHYEVLG